MRLHTWGALALALLLGGNDTQAHAQSGNVVFPAAISPEYSNDPPGPARMHTCLDQYVANKATGGNGGLMWIQSGGGHYSQCNKYLIDAAANGNPVPPVVAQAQGIQCPYPSTLVTTPTGAQWCRCPSGKGFMEGTGCGGPPSPAGVAQLSQPSVSFQIENGTTFCHQQMFVAGYPGSSTMTQAIISDFHDFADAVSVTDTLNSIAQAVIGRCGGDANVDVVVKARNFHEAGPGLLAAIRAIGGGEWKITMNNVQAALQQEEQARANAAAIAAQQQQAAAEAQARLQRKQSATADCGSEPSISGGPWFSSTYKTAAMDAARNPQFFCVKSIEYIGAAVNVFGGNAARARFTGYAAFTFEPVSVVMNFPY